MAFKEVICVLFVCLFARESASYCFSDRDCSSHKECCSGDCKYSCSSSYYYCYSSSQCSGSKVCCSNRCKSSCGLSVGVITGAVIGTIVFFGGVISFLSYFCCACCPFYRHRSPGNVVQVMPQPGGQQQLTVSTSTQQMQPYPQPGNYNQPPPGYSQAPPSYPGYLQPSAQYPGAQAQGQSPVRVGRPVKH